MGKSAAFETVVELCVCLAMIVVAIPFERTVASNEDSAPPVLYFIFDFALSTVSPVNGSLRITKCTRWKTIIKSIARKGMERQKTN